MRNQDTFDVAVIGAGVFGAWTAVQLQAAGARVVLLDAYGPGNSRSSSGGESRIIRMGYGPDESYTRSAKRSLELWQSFFSEIGAGQHAAVPLFYPTGVLWLAREGDLYSEATLATLSRSGIAFARLDQKALATRFPQIELGPVSWGILEPNSGVLMARQAVRALVAHARTLGVSYFEQPALPPRTDGQLQTIVTVAGKAIHAGAFVFACGPWLPALFPFLSELIHVTRQEVFFFGNPAKGSRFVASELPAWIDFNDLVYAIPDVDGRGFKIAIDAHGPAFDPDTGDRVVSDKGLKAVRDYLSQRLPSFMGSPLLEGRVCQYENTSNGDFLLDRHPDFENVWLVGGGSGHGFKHGPAVGEYVAGLISGEVRVEPRFTLSSKTRIRERKVF